MRIAIWHNLPGGGGKRALYEQIRGLIQRGHSVEAWCPTSASQTYWPLGRLVTEHTLPLDWQHREYRDAIRKPFNSYWNVASLLKAMEQHCRQCAEQIEAANFDVLLAGACTFFRVSPIARYLRLPRVLYLQEPYRWLYEALPTLPWLAMQPPRRFWWSPRYLRAFIPNAIDVQAKRVQAREENRNVRAFDVILANSYYSRESILRAYGVEARVCYLGVDTTHFRPLGYDREDFIVGLGAFVREKNIGFVLEALACLPEPRPRLVWIGNTFPDSANYIAELNRFASAVRIPFETRCDIPDAEMIGLLNRAELMVYAPRLEPFGLAPLEANACGLPVVAVAEAGIRETIKTGVNGLLVEPSVEALAAGIERLLSDSAYRQRLGQTAVQYVADHWSLDGAVSRLETHLLSTISETAG